MDVAFQTTIDYGGLGRFSVGLLRELAEYCDNITVYPTFLSVHNLVEHEWWNNMPANIDVRERHGLVTSFIRDSVAFRQHDIVHVNYASLGVPALVARKCWNTPYVYTLHHYDTPSEISDNWLRQMQYWLDLRVFHKVLSRYGNVVTVSDFNRRRTLETDGVDAEVIYHGINPESYQNPPNIGVRERFDLQLDSDILLFVGKLHGYKNIPLLIRAFEIVAELNDDVELVLLSGGGKDKDRVESMIRNIEPSNRVTLIEKIEDDLLYSFYNEASVLVLPSTNEAFGLVLLEAMAAELPVIFVNRGAAPEVMGNAGIPVPNDDPKALASTIQSLLASPNCRTELANRGADRVQRFTWERAARQYAELYRTRIDSHS